MIGLFDVLGQLVEAALAFIPRPMIVRATHMGIRHRWGKAHVVRPGWRWYWPLTTELETHVVVSQPLELSAQTLMTKDGHSVVASGIALYRVTDVYRYAVENFDSDEAMGEVAGSAIRDAVVARTLAELQEPDGRKAISKTLEALARHEFKRYGVECDYFKLTDLSVCRVLNLVGETGSTVVADEA